MKRPLAVIGYTYLAALVVAFFLGLSALGVLSITLLLGLAVALKSSRLRRTLVVPTVLVTALCAMGMLWFYTGVFITPTDICHGQTAAMEAELCESPYEQYDRYYYHLRAQSLRLSDGTNVQHVRVLVSSSEPLAMDYFDRLSAEVHFSNTTADYRLAKGVLLTGYLPRPEEAVVIPVRQKPLFYHVLKIRAALAGIFDDTLPSEQAKFVSALLLGEKSDVDAAVQENLRSVGLSHILVVSGMHLSFLTALCLWVLKRVLGHRNVSIGISMVLVVLYMAIAGFSASIVRAGIMQLVTLAGWLLGETSDSYHSLGLTVLVMLLRNPYAAMDVGLLLSFSATLGMIFVANLFQKVQKERGKLEPEQKQRFWLRVIHALYQYLVGLIGLTAAAVVFTLPVTLLYFRRLPLYAVLTNLAVAPILPLLMVSAVLLLMLHGGIFLPAVVGFLVQYVNTVAEQIEQWPLSVLTLSQRFIPWWLAGMALLAVLLLLFKGKRYRRRLFAVIAVTTLVLGTTLTELFDRQVVRIAVLDTGEGMTVLLLQEHEAAVLSCGGDYNGYNIVKDYLNGTQTKSLSLLMLTDRGWSCSAYGERLLSDFPTDTVLVYDLQRWPDSLQQALTNVNYAQCCDSRTAPRQQLMYKDKTLIAYKDKTHHAVYADLNGYHILMCQGEMDAALLPDDWQQGDLLILHGRIDNKQVLSYNAAIVADRADHARQYLSLAQRENIWYTWDGQHIVVRLSPDHATEIRRERLWVS